jgi:hypothetical protein
MLWQVVFDSLAPVFLAIVVGALLRRLRFLPESFFGGLNQLAFWVCLPCMLFMEISRCRLPVGAAHDVSLLLVFATAPALLVTWLLMRLLRVVPFSRGAFLQGGVRGNLAYVGIPVIAYALPQASGLAALAMAPVIPFYNVLCVLLLSAYSLNHGGLWQRCRVALISIITNPLIIACVLGLVAFAWRITLPSAVGKTLDMFGKAGLPTALLALGASLTFERVRGHFMVATVSSLVRVLVGPLVGWWLAARFGLAGDMRTMALLFLACPTAVASFVVADQMGADKDLAGAIVVLSTLYAFPVMAVVLMLTAA